VHAPFSINFRREVFRRERERSRARLFQLGGWVSYFGLMALLIGLYGLNCQWVTDHAHNVESQVDRMRKGAASGAWQPSASQVQDIQGKRENAARWRERLERLSALMPPQAILSSVAVNPNNLPGVADQNLFEITGNMKVRPGTGSSMGEVVGLMSRLKADSVFARGFSSFKLASSEMVEGSPPTVRFTVQCR
jgi:hypothetical protein